MVEQLEVLRTRARSCALTIPDVADTEWDEDAFLQLDSKLAFFQVTLEKAAESSNPDVTRILIESEPFANAVLNLQTRLGTEQE